MKVSVIIPVYKVEKYIERCLNSILNQTLEDIEIIAVNDCSPDRSADIISDIAAKDTRITLINLERNMGPSIAREVGYKAAKGDYIVFCDGDDYLPLEALERLYESIESSRAEIVIGDFEYIDIKGNRKELKNSLFYGNSAIDVYRSLLKKEVSHSLCGKIFRSKLFKDFQYFNEEGFTNGEDCALFYQIVSHTTKVTSIHIPVYYYCQNMQSSSNVTLSERQLANFVLASKIRCQVLEDYPELNRLLNRYIVNIFVKLIAFGYCKNTIYRLLGDKDMLGLFSKGNIKTCFSLKERCKIYLILNCSFFTRYIFMLKRFF